MRTHTRRQYKMPPEVISGYELDSDEPGWLSVVLPKGATNIVANPSLEIGTTGWNVNGAGSNARVASQQHEGTYSLEVTPGAGTTDGCYYGTVALTVGITYWASVWFKGGVAGNKYEIKFFSTAGLGLGQPYTFVSTGRWQRVAVPYLETATNSRRIYIRKSSQSNSADTVPFYVDGLQVEANQLTTYLDGDKKGFVKNRADFYWLGAPHGSFSVRIPQSRAGGILMPLKKLGFHLLALIGLSMAPVRDTVTPTARGGAQFQDSVADTRPFTVVGYIEGSDPQAIGQYRQALVDAFKLDAVTPRQPVVLRYQLSDCGQPIGDAVNIVCNYQDGLRGEINNNFQERLGIQFNMYLPMLVSVGSAGSNLSYQTSLTSTNYALARIAGTWAKLGTGMNGVVVDVRSDPGLGRVYYGGGFTTGNGVTLNGIGYWDVGTQTFVAMGTGTNGQVNAIAIAPNHDVWIVGDFSTVGGVATTGLARWNYATSTWTAFNIATGSFMALYAVTVDDSNNVYIGGTFTNWNLVPTADHFAIYSAAGAWSGPTTAITGGIPAVFSLVVAPSGKIILGGSFTSPDDYLISYDPATNVLSAFMPAVVSILDAPVQTLDYSPYGVLAAGGSFTAPSNYLLLFNGPYPHGFVNGPNNIVYRVRWHPDGTLYLSGAFTAAGGLAVNDRIVNLHSGNQFTPLSVDLPGAAIPYGIDFLGDDIYLGFDTAGTAVAAAGVTTLNNTGSAEAWPRFVLTGPATVVSIRNVTTGKSLFFDLTLLAGETAILEISPTRVTFVSSFRGNILGTILPGSNQADFTLKPGNNDISVAYSGTVSAATLFLADWHAAHHGLDSVIPRRIITP